MTKAKLLRATASTLTSLGLVAGFSGGFVGAASGTNNNTGPDSHNKVISKTENRTRVRNNTDVGLGNMTLQNAQSGSAWVHENTNGGSAASGAVSNANNTSASVSTNNSAGVASVAGAMGGGSSSNNTGTNNNTGPDSHNVVVSKTENSVKVSNDTDVHVFNVTAQNAQSGSASVSENTNGGNATTGSASNTNSSTFTVNTTN